MFDRRLQPWLRSRLQPSAQWLARRSVSADAVTVCGFILGMTSVPCLASREFGLALALILANRFLDGLDGAIARIAGPTDRGAFLDIALDFVFYSAVPFGFALAEPEANAVAASALLLGFMGTGSSFLAFAILAQKRGLTSTAFPHKGIYYLGGLTEGAETIAAFAAMCLFPQHFAVLAWIFSGLCVVTTLTRWWWGWRALSALPRP
ncbi:MAG: CDP-alcohol phosphatidyltransferase family protein [Geminicoccaceae bacterium]